MPSISFAITCCNERVELEQLLNQILKYIRKEDEIIVQFDTEHGTQDVRDFLENINTEYAIKGIKFHRIFFKLNNDFATFKNNLKKHCVCEWVCQIDADELFHENLISNLPLILEKNDVDVILVPRENYVEDLTTEDVKNYLWRIDDNKRINYPDFQWRLWRNKKEIFWKNKVHEQLTGYVTLCQLPYDVEGYCLIHIKDIERQRKQNEFYSKL